MSDVNPVVQELEQARQVREAAGAQLAGDVAGQNATLDMSRQMYVLWVQYAAKVDPGEQGTQTHIYGFSADRDMLIKRGQEFDNEHYDQLAWSVYLVEALPKAWVS